MDLEKSDLDQEIQKMFDDNKLNDLKTFMRRKECLNTCNVWILYLFHILQSSGIIVTTISAGYNDTNMIWVGVCLNVSASLLHIYEKNNNAMIHRLSKEIVLIKEGKYIDESILVNIDEAHVQNTNPSPYTRRTNSRRSITETKLDTVSSVSV